MADDKEPPRIRITEGDIPKTPLQRVIKRIKDHLDPQRKNPAPYNWAETIEAIRIEDIPPEFLTPSQLAQRIKVHPHVEEMSNQELDSKIKILPRIRTQPRVRVHPKVEQSGGTQIRLTQEEIEGMVRLVSVEGNQSAAVNFVNVLRHNPPVRPDGIRLYPEDRYSGIQWFDMADLIKLADRWSVPLLLIRKTQERHWVLGLAEPQRVDNQWKALVYDPVKNHEDWITLPGWIDNYADGSQLWAHDIYPNSLVMEELKKGTYDLSLIGDKELANMPETMGAKRANTQFNAWDCGPLTVFMAAVRRGAKIGDNEFKRNGRELLEKDTGVKILTREEIITGLNPPQAPR